MSERKIPEEPINNIDEVKRIVFAETDEAMRHMDIFNDDKRGFMYREAKAKWRKLADLLMLLGWWEEWMDFAYGEDK